MLKALVVQLLEELQKANARLERQEHHMHLLLKRLYGSTSEKFDPRQGVLFERRRTRKRLADTLAACRGRPPASPASKNRDKHGRGRVPDKIEREEEIHDLSDAEKAALGGAENLVELPPETERATRLAALDAVRRPSMSARIRPQGATSRERPDAGGAERGGGHKPPEAIPGALAGPGLMAQVIVSKGADHLPLHRLEGIFQRQGVRSRGRRWTAGGFRRPSSSSPCTRWRSAWCWRRTSSTRTTPR